MLSERGRILKIILSLNKVRPNAKSELLHDTALDFLVAVILSAQATDKGVNKATPELFKKYNTASSYAKASPEDIYAYIKSINFYKTKAVRIIEACKYIVGNFNGEVPKHVDELVKIPGIARKSANVISQELFNVVEGIVVDTHVTRVSQRLGFTEEKNAVKIEKDLMNLLPREYWKGYGVQIVLHGRYICVAGKPKCLECPINKLCPSAQI